MSRRKPKEAAAAKALLQQGELVFRTYQHTVLPLHEAIIDAFCQAEKVPLELATVLEDIGQAYLRLAEELNRELVRRGRLGQEPDAEDAGEVRLEAFVRQIVAGIGVLSFRDGRVVDGRRAIEAFPPATDTMKTAILLAKSGLIAP